MTTTVSHRINNPFNTMKEIIIQDEYTGEDVSISKINISKYVKTIYVLCPLSTEMNDEICMQTLNKDKLIESLQKMIIYKTSTTIVKNSIHYHNIVTLDKELISHSNHFNYDLLDTVFVLPIFNISFLNLQQYLNNFSETTDLSKLYNLVVLSDFFSEDINNINNKMNVESIIKTLKESRYWSKPYQCKLNITTNWNKRRFIFSNIKTINNDELSDFLKSLDKVGVKENYLEEIFKSKNYIDPSTTVKRKGYTLFSPVKSCDFNKDDIYNLFSRLNNYQKYLLFSKMVISKNYCHLVLNNIQILNMMKSYIYKFSELYEYLFGYAWIRFYLEECIKRSYVKTSDPFIFDIDTASKLPVFMFNKYNPHHNPYMPILVGNHSLNPEFNIGGVEIDYDNKPTHRICTLDEFKIRFNIFTTNNSTTDLFKNINFKENKMAISGSVMTACLQYKHPLLDLFNGQDTIGDIDQIYNRFFNEYYSESDIDIMIKTSDMFEFIDISTKLYNQVTQNLLSFNPTFEYNHIKMDITKRIYLFVTEEFIKNNIVKQDLPYEFIVSNLQKEKVIALFSAYIEKQHINKIKHELKDFNDDEINILKSKYPIYFEYIHGKNINIKLSKKELKNTPINISTPMDFTDAEIDTIIDNANGNQNGINPINKNIDTCGISLAFNFKTKISSPYIDHPLEVFPIKGDDFFASVSQFHLPCVRAYYDNNNVYMTPSCVSAHLTFMNLDYKYFAGTNDPLEIINKYRMRGFGTWLNNDEIRMFIRYSARIPFWNNLYQIDLNKPNTFSHSLGFIKMDHRLFHPRQYNPDYYWQKPNVKPIPLDNPYIDIKLSKISKFNGQMYLKNRYNSIDIAKNLITLGSENYFYHINTITGYVNPVKDNIIDIVWQLYELPNTDIEEDVGEEPKKKFGNKIKWDNNVIGPIDNKTIGTWTAEYNQTSEPLAEDDNGNSNMDV